MAVTETCKIVTGKYQISVALSHIKESTYVTRGNDLRLKKFHVDYDLRKFSFSDRVAYWVVSANTAGTFKAQLDKFWHNQDIVYNFRAQLQGTGSRSDMLMSNSSKFVYCEVITGT